MALYKFFLVWEKKIPLYTFSSARSHLLRHKSYTNEALGITNLKLLKITEIQSKFPFQKPRELATTSKKCLNGSIHCAFIEYLLHATCVNQRFFLNYVSVFKKLTMREEERYIHCNKNIYKEFLDVSIKKMLSSRNTMQTTM